ncbi:hypothetical protein HW278_06640 [Capnocytophaga sp. oral taxon 902]|uniref:hypothetical protein n=1 Tax=Capnocytophaga sp. oral taxon 902 TaxID=2748316 RepID=UPI0015BFF9B2|nr:hypothetical protein [Capnocytophaga sp. oral taxon 902]QLF50408.1 hypothetical protein HW278_06640 [Capnocytophaga sp. oral taxon 902]
MIVPIGKFRLSLTGENSHTVNISAGQGGFSIAPKKMGEKADAYVDADTPIQWTAFNGLEVPAGGNWPRGFYYIGNDSSFIEWSKRHEIENFVWKLLAPASVDFTNAQIRHLSVHNNGFEFSIKLDNTYLRSVVLGGNPDKITIESTMGVKNITFGIETDKKSNEPVVLPHFPALKDIERIEISMPIIGQAFDCGSLLQFKQLKSVTLWGSLCNFEALAQIPQLTAIGVRYCPDMTGFPPLSTWKDLNYFIVWNAEELTGKRLKEELKEVNKTHSFEYASVSQLRKKTWFATEYNIPFTNWEGKNGREAMKAYKAALKAIKKAKDEKEAKGFLVALMQVINNLPNIETEERADTAEALQQLAACAPFTIKEEKVQEWFEEYID